MTWRPITSDPDSRPNTPAQEGWYLLRATGKTESGRPWTVYLAAEMEMDMGRPWWADANNAPADIDKWDGYTRIEDTG